MGALFQARIKFFTVTGPFWVRTLTLPCNVSNVAVGLLMSNLEEAWEPCLSLGSCFWEQGP